MERYGHTFTLSMIAQGVVIGILVFKDPVSFWRIFFITTLIASIVGLKTVSSH